MENCLKEVKAINQRSQSSEGLKRATFWMQEPVLTWIRNYSKVSGISQAALINAIILDFQLKKLDPTLTDPAKVAGLRRYVDVLLGAAPPIVPGAAYRVARDPAPRQFPKSPK